MVLATKERIIADRQFATERYILSTLPSLYLPLHRLDSGDSGGKFISADGHGRVCTVTGALISQGGRTFDGSDDKIIIPSADTLSLRNNGSVLLWIKVSTRQAKWIRYTSR